MSNTRHNPTRIVTKLRQFDALVGQGMARVDAIREARKTDQTSPRWRRHHGGMGLNLMTSYRRTDDGKAFRTPNIFHEFSRERLAIEVERGLNATSVIEKLSDLFILSWRARHHPLRQWSRVLRQSVGDWIAAVGAERAYIKSGSPWENGYWRASIPDSATNF